MVVLNYTGGEVNAKIVYYGPGLSGKTTNLEFIHDRTPENARGKMVSMKTQTDRTLFFDFLPLELGEINGYRTRFLLYTVPGQVYYNATRKLVLKGADAIVFVADSSRGKLDENLESLRNLEQNLNEHGMSLDELPWVIQYNKRDASDAMAVTDLDARLNPLRVPSFEAVATHGKGVYETFHGIATLVYTVLKERLERELAAGVAPSTPAQASAPAAATRAAAPSAPTGEIEFDSAIDSMLREMDVPGRATPPAPNPFVQGTVNTAVVAAVTPSPVPVATATTPPRAQSAAPASPAPLAATVAPAAASPAREAAGFERVPESFDAELGRLPALEDAAFASESAREEGPNEFVTDPMRRPVAKAAAPAPRMEPATRVEAATLVAESEPRVEVAPKAEPASRVDVAPKVDPAPRGDVAPKVEPSPRVEPVAAPAVIEVPVVLTRAQARPGASIRVVLDIRIADE